MDYQVTWLAGAVEDLEAIAAFIAADSPAHAAAVVSRMLACAEELAQFPYAHRQVPELDDESIRQRWSTTTGWSSAFATSPSASRCLP